jgi:hypothetical protein
MFIRHWFLSVRRTSSDAACSVLPRAQQAVRSVSLMKSRGMSKVPHDRRGELRRERAGRARVESNGPSEARMGGGDEATASQATARWPRSSDGRGAVPAPRLSAGTLGRPEPPPCKAVAQPPPHPLHPLLAPPVARRSQSREAVHTLVHTRVHTRVHACRASKPVARGR